MVNTAVDNSTLKGPSGVAMLGPGRVWLGAVVPKRHARRAVTRSLMKRQIRAVVAERTTRLAHGLWVVRLRAPFDRKQYPSAASAVLQRLVRAELEQLLQRIPQHNSIAH